jgi:hypothetical protein
MFTAKITKDRPLFISPDTQAQLQTIFLKALANWQGVDNQKLHNGVFLTGEDINLILSEQTRQFQIGPIAKTGVLYHTDIHSALKILQLLNNLETIESQVETGWMLPWVRPFE